MLVMNRKERESIFIGKKDEIEVKILGVHNFEGEPVYRIGVQAAKDVPIRRDNYIPKAVKLPMAMQAENDSYSTTGDAA
jgi:sRNA-binding carbon storage regulator CsrA